jgi:flavorubredoxin
MPGGFSFNQYLVLDEEPLLFHAGLKRLFPLVREAMATVMAPERLRWVTSSHFESDEAGAIPEWLAVAPEASALCSQIGKMVSMDDYAPRPARGLVDGETIRIGKRTLRWIDAPHLPHGWDCGYLYDAADGLLFCGDLFTQPGAECAPLVDGDILGPSEAMRHQLDYFSHAKDARAKIERLAQLGPRTLACMHGSAWQGDGGQLLRALGEALEA